MRNFWCVCLLLLTVGCIEEKDSSSDPMAEDAAMADLGIGDATPDDVGPGDGAPADGVAPDAAMTDGLPMEDSAADAAVDATPDQSVGLEVDDCQSACARIIGCERFDQYPDAVACEAACERASRSAPPATWFECVELEACALLHLCRLPEPPPLTCQEVCDALDQCEGEVPLDCLAACEAEGEDGAFVECGEILYGGACETDDFWSCIGDQVYPDCAFRCEVGVECNVLRPDGCVLECIGQMGAADPLRALRATQMNQCIRASQRECRRVDACVNIDDEPGPIMVTRAAFCAAWNQCFADFLPCEFIWDDFPNGQAAAACIMQIIQNEGCPAFPDRVFDECLGGEPGPVGPGCNELCEAQSTCERLGEDEDQFSCVRDCTEVIRGGDEEAAQRLSALFPCGLAGSCDALDECLESNRPVASCAAHCARLDGCGLADEGCVERCDERFFRSRDSAHRACVREAEGCPAIEACARPLELDCARLCQRAGQCGLDDPDCESRCDDELFDDPRGSIEFAACMLLAPTCQGPSPSFRSCNQSGAPGRRCARYCLALDQCDLDAAEQRTDCLEACGDGYIGDEAIRFAAAGPCLEGLAQDAECAALEACIPDPVAPDCAAWCGALGDCEVAPAGCPGQCADDPLAQIRSFEQLACMGDAPQCAAVEGCLGDADAPNAGPRDEAAFCRFWAECGYDQLEPCEGLVRGMPDEIRICLFNELQGCPPFPFDAFEVCDDGREGGEGGGEILAACFDLCHAQAQCGEAQEGATIRGCTADCFETITGGAQEDSLRLQGFLSCRAALSCGALEICLTANSPEAACATYCGALDGCDLAGDDCAAICDEDFYRNRHEAARICALEAGEDCAALANCLPNPSLPCAYLCDRAGACGFEDPNCVPDCDDSHNDEPMQAGRQFACGVSAPQCFGLASNALNGCGGDDADGEACWSYCWARTGCDATDGAAVGTCLIECGEGFVGDEGLRFEESRGCIAAAEGEDACAAMADCIPEEVAVDCVPWCAALAQCEAWEGCVDACPEDALSRLRVVDQSACLGAAADDCDEVDACVVSARPAEVPPPDPVAFCADYRQCGFDNFIPCQQILQVAAGRAGALECLVANIEPCPRDPEILFDMCLGGQQAGPQIDYGPICGRMCQAQARCGLAPTHARDCAAACIGGLQAHDEGLVHTLVECRDALSCPALVACTDEAFGDDCDAPCNQYLDCGGEGFADLAACRDACNDNRLDPRARATYLVRVGECLTALLGDDGEGRALCAAEGLECFTPGRAGDVMSCEEVCPRLGQCGLFPPGNDQACIQGCLQADQEDFEGNEAVRACMTELLADGNCGDDIAIQECFDGQEREAPPPDRPVPDGPPMPERPDAPPEPPER